MKRKKIIISIIAVLILCCTIFVINLIQKHKYKTITLTKEPDYIGSSLYSEELAIVIDGNLVLYNKEGENRNIELDVYVTKAYLVEESIWVIDDKLNLYNVTYGNDDKIVMSDVVLSDVVSFECNPRNIAAINSKGEMYVWGDNSYGELGIAGKEYIETPTKVDYVSDVKGCVLHSGNAIVLTENGDIYVAGHNMEYDAFIDEFVKLDELNNVIYIECSHNYIYTQKNDGTVLVWRSLDFDTKDEVKIGVIEQKISDSINSLGINEFSMGLYFALGLNSQGKLYYWEFDFIKGAVGKGDYNYIDEPQKIPYLGTVDSMYGGKLVAYAKKGLVIYIIPGK